MVASATAFMWRTDTLTTDFDAFEHEKSTLVVAQRYCEKQSGIARARRPAGEIHQSHNMKLPMVHLSLAIIGKRPLLVSFRADVC